MRMDLGLLAVSYFRRRGKKKTIYDGDLYNLRSREIKVGKSGYFSKLFQMEGLPTVSHGHYAAIAAYCCTLLHILVK